MIILDYVLTISLLLVSILTFAVFCYAMVKVRTFVFGVVQSFQDFFESPAKGEPSDYDKSILNIAEAVGTCAGSGVMRAINGSVGGTMKGATKELEQQAIAENPNLALMGMMPKSIQKNPLAMIAMQQIMQRGGINLGGGASGGRGDHSSDNQSSFEI